MPPQEGPTSRRRAALAFAVVSADSAVRTDLEQLCKLWSQRLGLVLYPHVARAYGALSAQLVNGGVDVAWTPPLLAAELTQDKKGHIVACTRRSPASLYHSVIFTRRASGKRTLEDLQGASIAWVDRSSASGYVVPRLWMRQSGVDPDSHFSREVFASTHAGVVRAVLREEVDAGATFAAVDPATRKIIGAGWIDVADDPSDIEVVTLAGTVPADAIVAATRVADEARAALTQGLQSLADDERRLVKQIFRSEGFDPCGAAYLRALEQLADKAA